MPLVRRAVILYFTIVITASAPHPGSAQTLDHTLRGLSKLRLATENLGRSAAQCRVNVADIKNSLSQVLLAAGINIVSRAEERGAIFYLSVRSVYESSNKRCLSFVNADVYEGAFVKLPFFNAPRFAEVEFWRGSSVVGSNRADHAGRVKDAVSSMGGLMVVDWRLDNQAADEENTPTEIDNLPAAPANDESNSPKLRVQTHNQ